MGYTVGYGYDWYCCCMYSTISPFVFSVSLFPFPLSVSLLVSLRGRFTFLANAGRGSLREFLWCSCGCSQSSQNRAVHRNLKPVSPCLPHSRSVRLYFAQVHSCSYSLNLQIHLQSTLYSMMKIGLAQSFPHCAREFSGFPGFPGFPGSCGVRG